MHAAGESAKTIAVTLGVSAATVYRVLVRNEGLRSANMLPTRPAGIAGR
jgi:hypothetical protein